MAIPADHPEPTLEVRGRVTAPHLHYAVRVDGRYVDPASFMRLRLKPPVAELSRHHATDEQRTQQEEGRSNGR